MILWVLPNLGSQQMGPKRGLRMNILNFPVGMVSRQILIQWSSTRHRSSLNIGTLVRVPPSFLRFALLLLWLPWGLVFVTFLRDGAFDLVRPIRLSLLSLLAFSLSLIINFLSPLTGLKQVGEKICDTTGMLMWYDKISNELLWNIWCETRLNVVKRDELRWGEMRWDETVWNVLILWFQTALHFKRYQVEKWKMPVYVWDFKHK